MDNMIGTMWSDEDMAQLKAALCSIATEQGKQEALEILRHGYQVTTMKKAQFQEIYKAIEAVEVFTR